MPETLRFFRLRIRNALDSADLLVVTSVRGGTNPYIQGAPTGDGQSFEPLTGASATGSYRVQVVDEGNQAKAVTLVLSDVNARQQLLSKRSYLESGTDGVTWSAYVVGWCNAARLVTPGRFEIAVGDSRREEISTDVFKSVLLKRDPKGGSFPSMPGRPYFTRFTNVTMIVGGPVKQNFATARDHGGWVVTVSQVTGSGEGAYVQLKLKPNGWFRPWSPEEGANEYPDQGAINRINVETQPYYRRSPNWLGATTPIRGYFPDLFYRVETSTGTVVGYFTPIAEPQGSGVKREDYLTRVANGNSFWVAWTQSVQPGGGYVAAPTVGAEYRLYCFAPDVSEDNPLHVSGHPCDIQENLWLDANIPYDATSLAAVRALLGDIEVDLRPTTSYKLNDVSTMLGGLFGTATRIDSLGRRALFATRIKDHAIPSTIITLADLRSYEGTGWEIDEATVCNRLTLKQERYSDWDNSSGTQDQAPPDGVVMGTQTIIIDYGAASTPGDHETVYEIPGLIAGPFFQRTTTEDYLTGVAGEAFDRYGQGAPTGPDLHCLPSVTANLGDEIILNLPHLPNAILGASPVSQRGGQRIVQIVQRTETPSGPDIRWVDAGTTVQAATVPTFTLTANATDGRKYADIVVTNAVALAASGLKVRIEYATGAGTPTAGALVTTLDPALQSTMTLPSFDAGTKVWVRMRSDLAGFRPSAWTAFSSVTLTALNAPTSLAVAAQNPADISKRMLTWAVGANATDIPLEVYIRLAADPSTADRLLTTLPAGSTQYELTGLEVASWTASVRHRETPPAGGVSATVTVAVTTSGALYTLNPPTNPVGFSGPILDVVFHRPTSKGYFGLDVVATEFPSSVEIFMQIGAGASVSVGIVDSLQGQPTRWQAIAPNDGQTRTLKARHIKAGATASAFTANVVITNAWSYSATMYMPVGTLDDIPNGVLFHKTTVNALDGSGNIDLAAAGFVNKTIDNIPNGIVFRRTTVNAVDGSGNIDLSGSGFVNKDQDHVGDGSTWKRVTAVNGSNQITPPSSVGRNRCKVIVTGSPSQATGTTPTQFSAWTESAGAAAWDVGGLHDDSTNPSRITIPTGGNTGAWIFTGSMAFQFNATGDRSISIFKNGVAVIGSTMRATSTASNSTVFSVTYVDNAPSVGDFYEVFIWQNSGSTLSTGGGSAESFFSAIHLW